MKKDRWPKMKVVRKMKKVKDLLMSNFSNNKETFDEVKINKNRKEL